VIPATAPGLGDESEGVGFGLRMEKLGNGVVRGGVNLGELRNVMSVDGSEGNDSGSKGVNAVSGMVVLGRRMNAWDGILLLRSRVKGMVSMSNELCAEVSDGRVEVWGMLGVRTRGIVKCRSLVDDTWGTLCRGCSTLSVASTMLSDSSR
jgi:hypothetical protein